MESSQSHPPGSWLLRIDRVVDGATSTAITLLAVGGLFGEVWWFFDLTSHFWPFYGLVLAPAAGWNLWRRRATPAGVGTVALGVWLWPLGPYFVPRAVPDGTPLRVVVANLYSGNATPEKALQYLQQQDADVIVLLEVHPATWETFKGLRDAYPHSKVLPRTDNFGIALLSKRPVESLVQKRLGTAEIPSMIADIPSPPVRVIATHPLPPVGSTNTAHRNRHLADIAEVCRESSRPCVVAGDLNITPWSPTFRRLLADGNLQDSSWGRGLQPTWPSWTGVPLLPIDHLLVSPEIGVAGRRVGPDIGSDHRPVVVDLHLPQPPTADVHADR